MTQCSDKHFSRCPVNITATAVLVRLLVQKAEGFSPTRDQVGLNPPFLRLLASRGHRSPSFCVEFAVCLEMN